jgi:hypothetical protein
VLGLFLSILGTLGLSAGLQNFQEATGLAGTAVRFTVTDCVRHAATKSHYYNCDGTISPNLRVAYPILHDSGRDVPVGTALNSVNCYRDGHCFRTGVQQTAKAMLALCLCLIFEVLGLGLLSALVLAVWPERYRPQLSSRVRSWLWTVAGTAAAAVGLIFIGSIITAMVA